MRQMRNCMILTVLLFLATGTTVCAAVLSWVSPNHYRMLLDVTIPGIGWKNSPVSCSVNFQKALADKGAVGKFDENTIEVIAYDSSGRPKVYDASRKRYEKYLLPWRIDKCFGINTVKLNFVAPDHRNTKFAVYFDTVKSGLGKPKRYNGLVGDGDWFKEGFKRREIGANNSDDFCDFDSDGDLDLFKGAVEPYITYYENIGGNHLVNRGHLTSGGNETVFPYEFGNGRSWTAVEMADWDRDGDQDMFVHFGAGKYAPETVAYENTTNEHGGVLTFVDHGRVRTTNGTLLDTCMTILDWDGDGDQDMLTGLQAVVSLIENVDTDGDPWTFNLKEPVPIKANGEPIVSWWPRVDCGDMDNDGDRDMLMGMNDGRVYLFTNEAGNGKPPVFSEGRIIVWGEGGYTDLGAGVKIHDFDGDGRLDFVVGRFWERTHYGEDPRLYGRAYKNVSTPGNLRFEAEDAYHGAPYTEGFQKCDALRQNGVRGVDWDSDGRTDLIASDTDGFVWFFRNTTNQLFPVFDTGVRLMTTDQQYVHVLGEEDLRMRDGYARVDTTDWNEDGLLDLVASDGRGWLTLYMNCGKPGQPALSPGVRLCAYNSARTQLSPIDGTSRSSVLICDWDGDGKKDVIQAMGWPGFSLRYDWPAPPGDPDGIPNKNDTGYLFFKNIGLNNEPILDYPKWITDKNGKLITYTSRPNLGSFVDWDSDGRKDFITGQFEANVRLYKNISTAPLPSEPVFGNIDGVHIVQPSCTQMISGADAIDWNRDGDLDILTGQGHGGSGLRFFERDYIEDFLNKTYPTVKFGQIERREAAGKL